MKHISISFILLHTNLVAVNNINFLMVCMGGGSEVQACLNFILCSKSRKAAYSRAAITQGINMAGHQSGDHLWVNLPKQV